MGFHRDLMRGSLDLMILSVLAEGPMYGYLIQKRVDEASAGQIKLKAGTLYRLLHRMEATGAIKSRWDTTTGRERKWYELTRAGRRTLNSHVAEWQRFSACVAELVRPVVEGGSEGQPHPA